MPTKKDKAPRLSKKLAQYTLAGGLLVSEKKIEWDPLDAGIFLTYPFLPPHFFLPGL